MHALTGGSRKTKSTTWVFHSAEFSSLHDPNASARAATTTASDALLADFVPSTQSVIPATEFDAWFEKRLFLKYSHGLEGVLAAIRSLLLIWVAFQDCMMDLGGQLEASRHPALLAYKICVDNVVHIVDAVSANFPICIDYNFLRCFIETNKESMSAIVTHMHPFDHLSNDITESALLRSVQQLVANAHQTMSQLPSALECLIYAIDSSAPLTKKLSALKELFKSPIQNLLDDIQYLEANADVPSSYEARRDAYLDIEIKYRTMLQDELVSKGRNLKERIDTIGTSILSMLEPFPKAYGLIKSKGKRLEGALENTTAVSKFIVLLQNISNTPKASLFAVMSDSFDDFAEFLKAIQEMSSQNMSTFPRKQQQILHDVLLHPPPLFRKKLDEWNSSSKQLESLELVPNYVKKMTEFKELASLFEEALKSYNQMVVDMQKCIATYNRAIEGYNQLRFQISKCCLGEFGERIELSVPGMNGPNVMLWTGGD